MVKGIKTNGYVFKLKLKEKLFSKIFTIFICIHVYEWACILLDFKCFVFFFKFCQNCCSVLLSADKLSQHLKTKIHMNWCRWWWWCLFTVNISSHSIRYETIESNITIPCHKIYSTLIEWNAQHLILILIYLKCSLMKKTVLFFIVVDAFSASCRYTKFQKKKKNYNKKLFRKYN